MRNAGAPHMLLQIVLERVFLLFILLCRTLPARAVVVNFNFVAIEPNPIWPVGFEFNAEA